MCVYGVEFFFDHTVLPSEELSCGLSINWPGSKDSLGYKLCSSDVFVMQRCSSYFTFILENVLAVTYCVLCRTKICFRFAAGMKKAVGWSWSSGKAEGGSIHCYHSRVCGLLQVHMK